RHVNGNHATDHRQRNVEHHLDGELHRIEVGIQQDHDAESRQDREHGDHTRSRLLAFELTTDFKEEPFRKLHFVESYFDIIDDRSKVAALRVRHYDDTTARVLVVDGVGTRRPLQSGY